MRGTSFPAQLWHAKGSLENLSAFVALRLTLTKQTGVLSCQFRVPSSEHMPEDCTNCTYTDIYANLRTFHVISDFYSHIYLCVYIDMYVCTAKVVKCWMKYEYINKMCRLADILNFCIYTRTYGFTFILYIWMYVCTIYEYENISKIPWNIETVDYKRHIHICIYICTNHLLYMHIQDQVCICACVCTTRFI